MKNLDQKIESWKITLKIYEVFTVILFSLGLSFIIVDGFILGYNALHIILNHILIYTAVGILFIFTIAIEGVINTLKIRKLELNNKN